MRLLTSLATAALIAGCCTAAAEEYKRFDVGTTLTFSRGGLSVRSHFACFEKENTLAAYQLWADRWNGSSLGVEAVNRFVQAHEDLDAERARDERAGRARPASTFWRNICTTIDSGAWKIQQVYNWRDPKESNAQLVCLESTLKFDPRPPGQQEEAGPFKPVCWWAALFMPPTIFRGDADPFLAPR